MGAHQKIDRIARRQISVLISDDGNFPSIKSILKFEGYHGPDAVKRKNPSKDEPWHFINPFDDNDTKLLVSIKEHRDNLVIALKSGNKERAAFEAAWLAHAIVDGLTPAHHHSYEEDLEALNDGLSLHDRDSIKKKIIMPGASKRIALINNWKAWGPRGVRTAHGLFEIGVAALIAPLRFGDIKISKTDTESMQSLGIEQWFRNIAREIAVMDMYNTYCQKGWTPKLAWQVRHKLGPILVKSVALAWQNALNEAES